MSSEIKIEKENTFKVIVEVINEMVNFIKPTYGPASNKILIDKFLYKMVVDDGVQAARDFELSNPIKNAIVRIIRETAIATNDRSKDGTTGALIITQAIINEVAKKSKFDGRKIELELKKAFKEVEVELKKSTKQIKTKEHIKKVALTAFDNEEIAEMIADLYYKLGKDSVITVDASPTMKTYVEMSEGISINSGYIAPFMVNNPERMECELIDPYILLTDYRMTEINDIHPLLKKMGAEGIKNLVVIAENVEQKALAALAVNLPQIIDPNTRKPGSIPSVAIAISSKDDRATTLEDIALMTGAKFFSHSKGDKLESATIEDLGRAKKVVVKREDSVIVGPKGPKKDINNAIKALRLAIKNEKNEKTKKKLIKRLGMFTNSIAVIKIGAPTNNELKGIKYKVEDTINSTKAALKDGGVCGSGLALHNIKTSSKILNEALKYPARQLRENMGLEDSIEFKKDQAENVVTGKIGNFLDVGVVDPVDTLIAGVDSAISIASVLLTISGIIAETEKTPEANQ